MLAADLLDPGECRRVAAQRFTPAVMAARYVELYERVRGLAGIPLVRPGRQRVDRLAASLGSDSAG